MDTSLKNTKLVKSIRATNSPNDNSGFSYISKEEFYNETGTLIEETSFYSNGEIENKDILTYLNGNLVEQKNYIDNNELTEQKNFFYDENSKLNREEILFLDGSKTVKNYKRQTAYLEIESIDSEEGLESIEKIKIDEKNRILVKEVFDEKNILIEKTENTFEGEKLILSKHFSKENDSHIEKLDYKNDNLKTRSIFTENGKLVQSVKFFYDDKNRLINYVYSNGYRIETEYNDDNNSKKEKHLQSNGIIDFQKEIFYDSNENIIKEVDFEQTVVFEYTFFD